MLFFLFSCLALSSPSFPSADLPSSPVTVTPLNKYSFLPTPPSSAPLSPLAVFEELLNEVQPQVNNNNGLDLTSTTATVDDETEDDDDKASDKTSDKATLCGDYTINGHYYNRNYVSCQEQGYVRRPSTITACELSQLHRDCVDRINMYRTGQLKFSNGQSDSLVASGLASLQQRKGSNQCSSAAAMGDLIANYQGGGGCAGAHTNAFVCGGGAVGQNSCCASGDGAWGSWDSEKYDTYAKVKTELFSCLQSMWDEGQTGSGGHWQNMRNPNYAHVSCGFAWSARGRVMMTQDFTSGASSCSPSCMSCTGATDGCTNNPCVCSGTTADTTVSSTCGSATVASASPSPSRARPSASRSPAPSGTRTASSASPSRLAAVSATRSRSPVPSPSRTPVKEDTPAAVVSVTASASSTPQASPAPSTQTADSSSMGMGMDMGMSVGMSVGMDMGMGMGM